MKLTVHATRISSETTTTAPTPMAVRMARRVRAAGDICTRPASAITTSFRRRLMK